MKVKILRRCIIDGYLRLAGEEAVIDDKNASYKNPNYVVIEEATKKASSTNAGKVSK